MNTDLEIELRKRISELETLLADSASGNLASKKEPKVSYHNYKERAEAMMKAASNPPKMKDLDEQTEAFLKVALETEVERLLEEFKATCFDNGVVDPFRLSAFITALSKTMGILVAAYFSEEDHEVIASRLVQGFCRNLEEQVALRTGKNATA